MSFDFNFVQAFVNQESKLRIECHNASCQSLRQFDLDLFPSLMCCKCCKCVISPKSVRSNSGAAPRNLQDRFEVMKRVATWRRIRAVRAYVRMLLVGQDLNATG